ncbi:beta-galactosidase trimerization domain-containing protein [Bacillota bacterium Meth-B3]
MKNAKRRVFLDMHFPDWPERQTATAFDPDEIADTMIRSNVDSVILYAKCQFGNFYYDTEIGHKHRGLGSLNLFPEVCRRLRAAGIEVIAYYSVSWDERISALHPEWLVEGPNGERDNLEEFRWSTLCLNSPYRQVVIDHLREISRMLKPDGFWIDMSIIGKDRCFCPHCRALYEAREGEPLDGARIASDERAQNRFTRFRYDYIEAFYREAYAAIRSILPDANLANNYWGYPYSNASMGSRAIGALTQADFVTGEAYTDWTGLGAPSFFSKFLRGAAGEGRPFEALIGRFLGTWDYTAKPDAQLALEAYTVASNGGTTTVDDEPFADGHLDADAYRAIGAAFAEIKRREHLLDGRPVKFAAIWHSQTSKDHYFHGAEDFAKSFAGAYRLLRELQCPADLVFDERLSSESLDGYRLLLLPSVAVIAPEHWAVIRRFAERGGLVVAAGPTGMYRVEDDRMVRDGAIPSELGLRMDALSGVTISYLSAEDESLRALLPRRAQLVRGRYVRAWAEGARVLARVVLPICETRGKRFFHNNLPAPYEPTEEAALTETTLGRGRVCWFAQDIFAQFARYHQVDLMTILRRLMETAGVRSPLALSCASNVEFALAEMPDRTVLHLVNFTPGMGVCCGTMDPFEGRYARTFEFVDRVNPIADLEIRVAGRFEKAHAFALDAELDVRIEGDETVLTLDRLYEWESIELR